MNNAPTATVEADPAAGKPAVKQAPATKRSSAKKSVAAKKVVRKSVTSTKVKKDSPKAAKKAKPTKQKMSPPKSIKTPKPKKPKLVRDSFTMPEQEYALLGQVKKACHAAGIDIKKSELLRIGVVHLAAMDLKKLKAAQTALTPLKAGRPKKSK
jgi:hypothetical protein